jgi:hypothetical protein
VVDCALHGKSTCRTSKYRSGSRLFPAPKGSRELQSQQRPGSTITHTPCHCPFLLPFFQHHLHTTFPSPAVDPRLCQSRSLSARPCCSLLRGISAHSFSTNKTPEFQPLRTESAQRALILILFFCKGTAGKRRPEHKLCICQTRTPSNQPFVTPHGN